jgi:hypothetical protein
MNERLTASVTSCRQKENDKLIEREGLSEPFNPNLIEQITDHKGTDHATQGMQLRVSIGGHVTGFLGLGLSARHQVKKIEPYL